MKAILIIALIPSIAFGRLFDSETSLVQRYGNPVAVKPECIAKSDNGKDIIPGANRIEFLKNGIRISAITFKGESVFEFFSKEDGSRLTDGEILKLVESNLLIKEPLLTKPRRDGIGAWLGDRGDGYSHDGMLEVIANSWTKSIADYKKTLEDARHKEQAKSVNGF